MRLFPLKYSPCVLFPVGPKKESGLANQNYTPSVIMPVIQRMRLIIRPNVLIGGRGGNGWTGTSVGGGRFNQEAARAG